MTLGGAVYGAAVLGAPEATPGLVDPPPPPPPPPPPTARRTPRPAHLEELAGGSDVQLLRTALGPALLSALDPVESGSAVTVAVRGPIATALDPVESAAEVSAAVAARFAVQLDPLASGTAVTLRAAPNLANIVDGTPIGLALLARATLLILPPLTGGAAVTGDGANSDYDDLTGTG